MRDETASIAIALIALLLGSCGNKQKAEPTEPPPAPDTAEMAAADTASPEYAAVGEAIDSTGGSVEAVPGPDTAEEPQAAADSHTPAKDGGQGPKNIKLASKAEEGPVDFPHRKHQKEASCATCHHTTKPGDKPVSCHDCHGPDKTTLGPKDAFHVTCKACHKKEGMKVECDECHGE